mmetsp:Transcript_144/g.448  ORF Transcript_144/g.448 Transcript_144/m.448 type:complete len:504 (+) Transcript_144:117-1628(+)
MFAPSQDQVRRPVASTNQEDVDNKTLRIENPERMVGSGFIQFPPQRPFATPIVQQTSQGFSPISGQAQDDASGKPYRPAPNSAAAQRKAAPGQPVAPAPSGAYGQAGMAAGNVLPMPTVPQPGGYAPPVGMQGYANHVMRPAPGVSGPGSLPMSSGVPIRPTPPYPQQAHGQGRYDQTQGAPAPQQPGQPQPSKPSAPQQPQTMPGLAPQNPFAGGPPTAVPGGYARPAPGSFGSLGVSVPTPTATSGALQQGATLGNPMYVQPGMQTSRPMGQPPVPGAYASAGNYAPAPPPAHGGVMYTTGLAQQPGPHTTMPRAPYPQRHGLPTVGYGQHQSAGGVQSYGQRSEKMPTAPLSNGSRPGFPPAPGATGESYGIQPQAGKKGSQPKPASRPVTAPPQKTPTPPPPLVPKPKGPVEELVSKLEDMGFPRTHAARAAHFCGQQNVQTAVEWIVEHQNDPDINEPPPSKTEKTANGTAPTNVALSKSQKKRERKKKREAGLTASA